MESSRVKPGFSGVSSLSDSRRSYMGAAAPSKPAVDGCGVALRVFILAATLVAAVVMGLDRQTSTVQVTIADKLPPLQVPVTAKWSYSSAFVYFVVANAMACVFSAVALAACRSRSAVAPLMVGDLVVLALLFSAVGAAAEFGILGERGNSHVRWGKVCHVYSQFCGRAMAAVIVSLVAAFANLVHLMFAILDVHKNSSYY
ncbi:CASP-like protein 1E1 [Hordeum vulgare]|uniref:CASP-like protein n=1 Tax=Hordeum vulgare subsp. vulgare TaxID=112509 RepID=F2DUM6_HORVV|nr:CASP-like protein 1E1 [Hordeum vulgare subsp. vulgare]KAE8783565.1 CASP-like protein 1E1 [Hordeum vulgare]KAI4964704.1 hypothetical protein ZWY2020_059948 [Hordeum vulgare]KAI4971312.1 hypothetical protein ZWY2020_002226 [Hordeum vulgare]BAJ98797.1 predicted protein [Hordeum vulgare subsp. vulgare]